MYHNCQLGFVCWLFETWGNPEEFSRTFLIGWFEGFWWSFVTMTTVGFGDKSPRSLIGRLYSVVWISIGVITYVHFSVNESQWALWRRCEFVERFDKKYFEDFIYQIFLDNREQINTQAHTYREALISYTFCTSVWKNCSTKHLICIMHFSLHVCNNQMVSLFREADNSHQVKM